MNASGDAGKTQQVSHRGVRWQREASGAVSWFDADGGRWVRWLPGADAPPRPPQWAAPWQARPGWRTRWRVIPVVLTVGVVIIAIVQSQQPSGNPVAKEAASSAALLGKCLAQNGVAAGHPRYSSSPVACSAPDASVRVAQVLPGTPGTPACPSGSTQFVRLYAGVRYPHRLCLVPAHGPLPSG